MVTITSTKTAAEKKLHISGVFTILAQEIQNISEKKVTERCQMMKHALKSLSIKYKYSQTPHLQMDSLHLQFISKLYYFAFCLCAL
jgi:hypothetical protein